MDRCVLHQFQYSHFNEKARWALAYKGLVHERRDYLPGPHIPLLRRLSGQPQTPVLVAAGEVIAGSASIIDYLERHNPTPALYPQDPELCAAALRYQQQFDRELGPAARTVLFSVLIDEPDYLCTMFANGKSALKRRLYRATLPIARRLIAKGNGVDSAISIAEAFAATERILGEIATLTAPCGYLVGDQFSVADLSAAALLAPLCDPPCADMQRPHPRPAALTALLERWQAHPACHWGIRMYREHRPE